MMIKRIGQQFGNYRLVRSLGQGGQAEVYLGEHIHLGTQRAVKLFDKLTGVEAQTFQTEVQAIKSLSHPHIVRVLEYGQEHQVPYLIMEYAKGGTLCHLYPRGSQVAIPLVVTFVKQIAAALAYAHSKKLIHRDVKPENMLISASNALLLSDFGIATAAHRTQSACTVPPVGTATYMAPEQIKGKPHPSSDQYALAVCAYEWLSGEPPFTGSTPVEIAMKHCSDRPPSLREKGVTTQGEEVLFRALAKEPKQRFPDILAFAQALEEAASSPKRTRTLTGLFPFLTRKQLSLAPTQTARRTLPHHRHNTPVSNTSARQTEQDYQQLGQRIRPHFTGMGSLVVRGDASQLGQVVYLLCEESWIRYPANRQQNAHVVLMKEYSVSDHTVPAAVFQYQLFPHTGYVVWTDHGRPMMLAHEDGVSFIDLRSRRR